MPAKKRTASKSSAVRKSARVTGHRSSWKGQLSFGLVSFAVEAFNALDREQGDIHFHQIHAKCHRRIKYLKVCPIHGEVSNDEIVSGYETAKDQYIELESDELQKLRKESDQTLKLEAFVAVDAIDPLYFDGRMYYLAPSGAASQGPYSVIVEAMAAENRCAVGHLIFSGKEQIVLLRPLDGVLHMAMLNYHAEFRPPASVVNVSGISKSLTKEVKLAQTLIEDWSDDQLDFSKFEDTHRESVEALLQKKLRGGKIVDAVEEEDEEPPVLNLMEALKRSVKPDSKRRAVKKKPVRRSA